MKISRDARKKYDLEEFQYSEFGNLNFEGDIYNIRKFVQKINERKDLLNYPELALKAGKFNGMTLISEINESLIKKYKEKTDNQHLNEELYDFLEERIGPEKLQLLIETLAKEFPPKAIYEEKIDIETYLNQERNGIKNKSHLLNEIISLWLGNENPSFKPYLELFDDDIIEKRTIYNEAVEEIIEFFEEKPKFGPENENLIEFLRKPFEEYPHSLREQLEYLYENWSEYLEDYIYKILLALDLIREEEMFRGPGSGKAKPYDYGLLEENFTPDKDWMPKVVMIAKNVYVWLDQLSKKYQKAISKLHEIPNEELDELREYGFNAIWLIGVWERSEASEKIKKWCGNPEAVASAYSVYDYFISNDLGGVESFQNLKERASMRNIMLASDMVPNHTGIFSRWIVEHPDWFISLSHPPFPSYSYSGVNLSDNQNIGVYLEDKYFDRTDAAVTFKHVEFNHNKTRFIYHGNDGTSFPWNDTAQLNYLLPEVREAVIQTILRVSRMFPIIRFDAAMTLTKRHYQRLWFPEPGTGGAIPSRAEHGLTREQFNKAMPNEFWREVVERINQENPDTLLLAEAFWLLEGYFVRTLGMHRVYNSAFMNMLRDEENSMYRLVMKNTLEFDPEILKRFVNFMSNPDEETAIKQFGTRDKYFGICMMMVTMPGLPMFGHGQIQGYHEKYGMEYKRSYWDEKIDYGLLNHHKKVVFPLMKKRYLFADVLNFQLYDFWTGNFVDEDVFAYSNRHINERALVIYNNKYKETKGFIKNSVGFAVNQKHDKKIVQKTLSEGLNLPFEGFCIFKDYNGGLEYLRRNKDIHNDGLYIELNGYQTFIFLDFRIVQDNEFFHYAQLYDFLSGKGVPNMNDALKDVIYQPIYEPFKKLINSSTINSLLKTNSRKKEMVNYEKEIQALLNSAESYLKGTGNLEVIKDLIMLKLRITLNYRNYLDRLSSHPKLIKFIQKLVPKSALEWGVFISWVVIHQLGRIQSEESYELRSRSLLDEWHLTKFLYNTFRELSDDDNSLENVGNAINLVKIMISQQNWYENQKQISAGFYLSRVFQDIEVQNYLNFNRYKEILWFKKEAFMVLIKWLIIVASSSFFEDDFEELRKNLQNLESLYKLWIDASKNSDYKVNKIIGILREQY